MRRVLLTLLVLSAAWMLASPAHAQHVNVTSEPGSPVSENTQVLVRVGIAPGAPDTAQGYRLIIQTASGTPVVRHPASPNEFAPYPANATPQYSWRATPPGTYTFIGIVRYANGATESGSVTNFVVAPPANPYRLAVDPASGAIAGQTITLSAQTSGGHPSGLHCIFEAVPATGNTITAMSAPCTPAQMRLAAGTWRLRLVVHRGTNPRGGPTLRETVGVQEIGNYVVGAATGSGGGTAVSCPSQCEARAGACVKPRGDTMRCLPGGRCPLGYGCTGGYCRQVPASSGPVLSCVTNANCPPRWSCQSRQCRAPVPSELVLQCDSNVDCSQGWICAANECRRTCP